MKTRILHSAKMKRTKEKNTKFNFFTFQSAYFYCGVISATKPLKERVSKKLNENQSIVFLVKHYGDRSKIIVQDLIELVSARYSLNTDFGFFIRTLLLEVLNNALRENYFYFLAGELWEEHINAMQEAGQEKAIREQSKERYILHLRGSLTFLNRVRDFNLKRVEIARTLDAKRKNGTRNLLNPGLESLIELNKRYKMFTSDHNNTVRFSIAPQDNEISFTIVNKSFLDELALERLRKKVIERIKDEKGNFEPFTENMLDTDGGGHGLGSFLIRDVLSEKGFNTIKESLVILPDPAREKVSTTLTLDSNDLEKFRANGKNS